MAEHVLEIIGDITGFMCYFAPGYFFLSCFHFSGLIEREKSVEYLIVKCVSFSYLFFACVNGFGKLKGWPSEKVQFVCVVVAVFAGLIAGRIFRSSIAEEMTQSFLNRGLSNSFLAYLNELANQNDYVIYVILVLKNDRGTYAGQLQRVDEHEKDPVMSLVLYQYFDRDSRLIYDCSNDDSATAVIHYSDVERLDYQLLENNK